MIQLEEKTAKEIDHFCSRLGPLQLRTEEESELGDSIGKAIFGQSKAEADCFAFVRSGKEDNGVYDKDGVYGKVVCPIL